MPLVPEWYDIVLRLLLTVVAGALIGMNRGEHGHPAGLRTTLLVCLAASVAMIQTNLMLATAGRRQDSFIMLDLMRLPLGILSGMGFIGGGAILKQGDMILGVTTAATLWFVTVIGLCFGGGQLLLGAAALVLGMVVLAGLKRIEGRFPQDRRGTLILSAEGDETKEEDVRRSIAGSGFRIVTMGLTRDIAAARSVLQLELLWRARPTETKQPAFLNELGQLPGVSRLEWRPKGPQGGPG